MTFGVATTDWVGFAEDGAYFRLEEGVLMVSAMLLQGGRDEESNEVAFDRIDDQDRERCTKIGRELQTPRVLVDVAAALSHEGYAVTVEYPGLLFITGSRPELVFTFGTLNGTWQGDACDASTLRPHAASTLSMNVPGDSTDFGVIADAIDHQLKNVF